MMDAGVDVFTVIAGGAAHGLITTATQRRAYIVWYNSDAYHIAPGIIAGCGTMEQKRLVMEILDDVLTGKMQYGISDTLGIREGYLGFVFDNPGYQNLPASIRGQFELFLYEKFNYRGTQSVAQNY
jgi:simple sugar transport system substrate-binding protein